MRRWTTRSRPIIFTMGCVANIVQSLKLPDGNIKVLVEGIERARAVEWKEDKGFYRVVVKGDPKAQGNRGRRGEHDEPRGVAVRTIREALEQPALRRDDCRRARGRSGQAGRHELPRHLLVGVDEKQNLLEIISPVERLNRIAGILEAEVDKLQVDRRIQSRVKKQMEKAQKEYYLNEKMKAIQKELGRKDEKGNEVDELRRRSIRRRCPKKSPRRRSRS